MIPKELNRDADGLTRLGRIEHADQLARQARSMAFVCMADTARGFADFADDDCPDCLTRAECGLHVYEDTLLDAADHYEAAGLGLLAERVRIIPQTCIHVAWGQFDSANATPEV